MATAGVRTSSPLLAIPRKRSSSRTGKKGKRKRAQTAASGQNTPSTQRTTTGRKRSSRRGKGSGATVLRKRAKSLRKRQRSGTARSIRRRRYRRQTGRTASSRRFRRRSAWYRKKRRTGQRRWRRTGRSGQRRSGESAQTSSAEVQSVPVYAPGVNLIGFIRAEMGLGEACRQLAGAMDQAGIPFGILNYPGAGAARHGDLSWAHRETQEAGYQVNVFHMNPDSLQHALQYFGQELFDHRYNIGYWAWELPEFPDEYVSAFSLVQEVWVPSQFIADSVAAKSPVPVIRIPHAVNMDPSIPADRSRFGLPQECFLFLSMYDPNSFEQRKNPLGAIRAFKRAFAPDRNDVGLVVKVSYPNEWELAKLQQEKGDWPNIIILAETMARDDVLCLMQSVDCFVSLHRSEGFGLVIAEMMALGKPVIATNWSGNTDFMNETNACAVGYQLVQIGEDIGPYKAYQIWAEPDLDHAASFMERLVSDPDYRRMIASLGQESVRGNLSPANVGTMIRNRLSELGFL